MKKSFTIIAIAALILSACSKDEPARLIEAIVTVCGEGVQKPTLNLDDNTVLVPENMSKNPYSKECRALILYQDKGETEPNTAGKKYRKVQLYRIDSVLTKSLAPDLGSAQNDAVYGTDPIDVYRSWLTVCEDGYITIHFLAGWGYPGTVHTINLVKGTDPADALHLQLRHNANGDLITPESRYREGIAAFNIKELLTKEAGAKYDIRISYITPVGSNDIVFHYTPGTSAILGQDSANNGSATANGINYKYN